MQMDIVVKIVSAIDNHYYGYNSYPAHSVFGQATLVFNDGFERRLPLEFGSNTVFYQRQEAAFDCWELYKAYAHLKYDFYRETNVIGQLASNLGFTVTPTPYQSPEWVGFEEIPLSEIFIKCPFGTTFDITHSYIQASPFKDMDDLETFPISRRPKDPERQGVPPKGLQPAAVPNKNNPYAGAKEPSSPFQLGDFNNNAKLPQNSSNPSSWYPNPNGLDAKDPDSFIPPEDWGYFLEAIAVHSLSGTKQQCTYYYLVSSQDIITQSSAGDDQTFSGFLHSYSRLTGSYSGVIDGFYHIGALTYSVKRFPNKPSNVCINVS
jgi:hypothetical protein